MLFGRRLTVGATHSTGCSQRSASLRMPLQKVKCQALSVLSPSMRTCADPSSGYASKSRAATDGHTPLQLGPRANLGAFGEESSGEAIAAAIEEVSWPEPPNAGTERVSVTLSAPDHETLLVDWLSELVFLIEDETFIPASVENLAITGDTLQADVAGGAGGELQRHIKAVTYHDLSIETTANGYQAQVVFDV